MIRAVLSSIERACSKHIRAIMIFAAGWSSCQIFFAISHSMAVRAMQDAKEESEDEDEPLREPREGDSLPLRHALENQEEEVKTVCGACRREIVLGMLAPAILLWLHWDKRVRTSPCDGRRRDGQRAGIGRERNEQGITNQLRHTPRARTQRAGRR